MCHNSPVSIDAVAAQGNNIGDAGMRALRPALEKLTSLTSLDMSGTCGYAQRRSAQCVCVSGG